MTTTPGWLRERVNDPYGTPNTSAFWSTVAAEVMGRFKVFTRGGRWFAYDTSQNAWWNLGSRDEAVALAARPRLDMWA